LGRDARSASLCRVDAEDGDDVSDERAMMMMCQTPGKVTKRKMDAFQGS